MNVESFVSFLSRSNWFFLTGLIVLLAAAFATTFSEKTGPDHPSVKGRTRPR